MKRLGAAAGSSAIYNVLRRHRINTRKLRLEYIRIKHELVKTATDLERARDTAKTRPLTTDYPGHIVGMDVFYVGTLKGVGRIFQVTAIDTCSSYGWAKLYTDKSALSACDFMMHVFNHSSEYSIRDCASPITVLEFTTHHASKNHSFERLNRTILEEFYQLAFRTKIYETLNQLNNDLEQYLKTYNYQRTHQGKRTNGRVPAELYLLHKKSAWTVNTLTKQYK